MIEAIRAADFLVTATGVRDIVTREALKAAKDGLVLSNAGHFNVEINLEHLADLATEQHEARHGIMEYVLGDGRRLYVLGEGRLVNLALGDGHPVEIMDHQLCAAGPYPPASGQRDLPAGGSVSGSG